MADVIRSVVNETAKGTWLEPYINHDFALERIDDKYAYFDMYDNRHNKTSHKAGLKYFDIK